MRVRRTAHDVRPIVIMTLKVVLRYLRRSLQSLHWPEEARKSHSIAEENYRLWRSVIRSDVVARLEAIMSDFSFRSMRTIT